MLLCSSDQVHDESRQVSLLIKARAGRNPAVHLYRQLLRASQRAIELLNASTLVKSVYFCCFRLEQCPVGPWTYDLRADLPNQVKPEFLPAVNALLEEVSRHATRSCRNLDCIARLPGAWCIGLLRAETEMDIL